MGGGSRRSTKEDHEHDLELEKTRLLSLALDFGFDHHSAAKCLDRLVALYGEDGRDFITVEHCGDDFIAALAEAVGDTEEWDDLQELESQACGTLAQVLDESTAAVGEVCYIDVIDDSPEPRKQQRKVVELDSSEDDDGVEFGVLRGRERCVPHGGSAKSVV